jgi:hypothetical protein
MTKRRNTKRSRSIEKFGSSSFERTFKLGIFGYCILLLIVYAGHLKGTIRIPLIAPGEAE